MNREGEQLFCALHLVDDVLDLLGFEASDELPTRLGPHVQLPVAHVVPVRRIGKLGIDVILLTTFSLVERKHTSCSLIF